MAVPYSNVFDPSNPYSQLNSLYWADAGARDRAVRGTLEQLNGPALTNLYATGGMDQLARQYRSGRQALSAGLAERGLSDTGAADVGTRGLMRSYNSGVYGTRAGAYGQEQARIQSLLNTLLGIGQGDVNYLKSYIGGLQGIKGANAGESNLDLMQNLMLAEGSAKTLATLAGGAYGAAGASGVSGATAGSTAMGGLQGATTAMQFGNALSGSPYMPSTYGPAQPGQTSGGNPYSGGNPWGVTVGNAPGSYFSPDMTNQMLTGQYIRLGGQY